MGSTQDNMAKKKKINRVLCYFALVILVVLLFTPMIFRIVFKDREIGKKKDVVTLLTCSKGNESISSSFLNGKSQKVTYSIQGNYMINNTDNEEKEKDQEEEKEKESTIDQTSPVLRKFLSYSSLAYNEETDQSVLNINVTTITDSVDYEMIFVSIDTQEEYYKTQGFGCNRSTLNN